MILAIKRNMCVLNTFDISFYNNNNNKTTKRLVILRKATSLHLSDALLTPPLYAAVYYCSDLLRYNKSDISLLTRVFKTSVVLFKPLLAEKK